MSKKIITYLSITAIVIGFIFLANGLILAWTPPACAPPNCNAPAPLNVGPLNQYKEGFLTIGNTVDPSFSLDVQKPGGFLGDFRTTGGAILNTGGAGTGLIVSSGRVGLGTQNPLTNLHIYDANDPTLYFDTAGTESWYIGLDDSSFDQLVIGRGTSVGSNVNIRLDNQGTLICRQNDCSLEVARTTLDVDGNITIEGDTGTLHYYNNAGFERASLQWDNANTRFRVRVQRTGVGVRDRIRMGVGSDNIKGDGVFADDAFGPSEWVIGQAEEGDLVCLTGAKIDEDGEQRATVKLCDTLNSSLIIGVVVAEDEGVHHGNPNFEYEDILGPDWEEKWKKTHLGIELTGFRKIKVVGPIKIGDLLVSSEVPGHAMASENPQAGTIIGKALEDFNGQKGAILARIHLQ